MAIPEYTQFEIYLQSDLQGLSRFEAEMESIRTHSAHTPRVAITFELLPTNPTGIDENIGKSRQSRLSGVKFQRQADR